MEMTESGVHEIVDSAFDKYEREIGWPRYVETTGKLTQVLSTMDKIDGGVTAIKHILRYLGGTIATLAGLVELVRALRGH